MPVDTGSSSRRILVLGGTGMLGQACVAHLRGEGQHHVDATDRRAAPPAWRIDVRHDTAQLWALLARERYDLVVNAIGVLRSAMMDPGAMRDGILVNAVFPHDLAARVAEAGSRLVHVSTDAVFSGRDGAPFDETSPPAPTDPYGASKWLGEPSAPGALTIRCSIVGRHPERRDGLIEWFRTLPPRAQVRGFTDYRWTPATTRQVARLIGQLSDRPLFDRLRDLSPVFHFAPNPPLSKWDMIDVLNGLRDGRVQVDPALYPAGPRDLGLTTRFEAFRRLFPEPRPWPAVLSEVWQ